MHPYEILDVFTETPLAGNPLAVFTRAEQLPSSGLMQAIARELNLSETVFLFPGDGDADARARIFTPVTELPFAGHPVLGSAFVVGAARQLETVRLRTDLGVIPIRLKRDHAGTVTFGEMDQPIPAALPFADADRLLVALGIDPSSHTAALPVETYTNGPTHVLVALDDPDLVSALRPDHRALTALGDLGFSCFAPLGPTVYRTRMFGPALGVAEDPATGSAAGPIAVHLLRHGRISSGQAIELRQGGEIGRPSILHASATGSPETVTRVTVSGAAVLVASGHFRL
jgi:trans-2,3-dihydro-3-hydroxyanthranilate isomerase